MPLNVSVPSLFSHRYRIIMDATYLLIFHISSYKSAITFLAVPSASLLPSKSFEVADYWSWLLVLTIADWVRSRSL